MADALCWARDSSPGRDTGFVETYTGLMNALRKALRAVEGFFRLMVGDTSMLEPPDLSPLDHVPSVEELLHRDKRNRRR